MKTNKKIIIIAGIILIFLGTYFYFDRENTPLSNLSQDISTELSWVYTANTEKSVYDFMDTLRQEGKITFTEKNYTGMGKFIETINGIQSNGDQNWIYYVNNQKAKVGVSNYKIKSGDVVSWKYEKSY